METEETVTQMVDIYSSDFGYIKIAAPSICKRFRIEKLYGSKAFCRGSTSWFAKFEKKINAAAAWFWMMGSCLLAVDEKGRFVIMEPEFPLAPAKPYIGSRARYIREIDDNTDVSQIVSEVCSTCIDGPVTFAEFMEQRR